MPHFFAILSTQKNQQFVHSILAQSFSDQSALLEQNITEHDNQSNLLCLGYFSELSATKFTLTASSRDVPVCFQGQLFTATKEANIKNNNQKDNHIYQQFQLTPQHYLKSIKGNFSYVLWDEDKQTLHAGITPFNNQQLYYCYVNDVCFISTSFQWLYHYTQVNKLLNHHALAQWLAGTPNPHTSMFNQIKTIPNGHLYQFNEKGLVKKESTWQLDTAKKIHYKQEKEYQEHFYYLLEKSIKNYVTVNKTPIFSQMSGGLDSTSITAILHKLTSRLNTSLHTISHTYEYTQSCDESEEINAMIAQLNNGKHHFIALDEYETMRFETLYPTSLENPGIVLSPKYHQELVLINKHQGNVLFTGNGGDEMCWGHSSTYRTRLLKGELTVIPEIIKGCRTLKQPVKQTMKNVFIKPLLPDMVVKLINMAKGLTIKQDKYPPWLTPKARHLIEQSNLIENPFSAYLQPDKFARFQAIFMTSTYNAMRSYQKVANQYNITVANPFFDESIAEFSFAIPQKQLIQQIYPKWLLRKTMDNYLPEKVCWKQQKVSFDFHFAKLIQHNAAEIRALLSHRGLEALGLLETQKLLEAFEQVIKQPNSQMTVELLYAILTQLWFQQHHSD